MVDAVHISKQMQEKAIQSILALRESIHTGTEAMIVASASPNPSVEVLKRAAQFTISNAQALIALIDRTAYP